MSRGPRRNISHLDFYHLSIEIDSKHPTFATLKAQGVYQLKKLAPHYESSSMQRNKTTLNVVGGGDERLVSLGHREMNQRPIFTHPTIDADAVKGPVCAPTIPQLLAIADELGLHVTSTDATSFINLMAPYIAAYNIVRTMPESLPQVRYPRAPGYHPVGDENRFNAWYVKSTVAGAASGKLQGKTIALKDNIMLAGVPMMNGASTLEGYTPEIDATVVERILDAGGTIVGKAHCESFCVSGGSHTNATGHVHNPRRPGFSAGGSSSGCAVLVANGEVDMAVGCDQAGSIRMPSSYCGIYGMKATHGLVPYTGIMPIEIYVDHVGPMTRTVADNALLLEVLAGPDGYDPRQYHVCTNSYTKTLEHGVRGLKIAIVKEGFEQPNSEADVNDAVRRAISKFEELGCTVSEISIPMHMAGQALFVPIATEGLTQTMMHGDGYGVSRPDLYVTSLMDTHRHWRTRADEISETTKLFTLLGTYIRQQYGSRYYGKAMNVTRLLTAAYDAVLNEFDLLVMPTTPNKAPPLPPIDSSREVVVRSALNMICNTAPFNISHHPALAIPCGICDGLPASMMLVGKHWDEATIYRAAYAFEQSCGLGKM